MPRIKNRQNISPHDLDVIFRGTDIVAKSAYSSDDILTEDWPDLQTLKFARSNNTENLMIGYLNINSIRNKIIVREVLKHFFLKYFFSQ